VLRPFCSNRDAWCRCCPRRCCILKDPLVWLLQLSTCGDVGHPASELRKRYPQLDAQLALLPEMWWHCPPSKPNCALTKCFGSRERHDNVVVSVDRVGVSEEEAAAGGCIPSASCGVPQADALAAPPPYSPPLLEGAHRRVPSLAPRAARTHHSGRGAQRVLALVRGGLPWLEAQLDEQLRVSPIALLIVQELAVLQELTGALPLPIFLPAAQEQHPPNFPRTAAACWPLVTSFYRFPVGCCLDTTKLPV
jgi:hypothetical protein